MLLENQSDTNTEWFEQNIPESKMVLRVHQSGDANTQDREAVIRFFAEIADREGWQPGGELTAYQDRSVFFGLFDSGYSHVEPVGGLQIVLPPLNNDPSALIPSQKVWPELQPEVLLSNRSSVYSLAHILVLAVHPDWRRKGTHWHLMTSLWRYCMQAEVRTIYLEATPTMLRCYKLWGLPLNVEGPLRVHWGEPCYPCSLDMRTVAGALAEKALRSAKYRRLFLQALAPY